MITLVLPFIPPTSNHTQKNAFRGKRIMRYNTSVYNDFKKRVEMELWKKNPEENLWAYSDVEVEAFTAFLASPHKVTISVHSPRVLTKKGEVSKTFGDVDNFIKPLLDAIYKPVDANDALVMQIIASKHHADKEYTFIEWEMI
jgi:Holliday junction resolvase RusA-like endonuclease